MKKIIYYLIVHFSITAWPFLNFYGSKTNHKLISIISFSLLFCIFWGIGLLVSELIRKFFKLSRERVLVLYTICIIWFFSFQAFENFIISNNLATYKPSYWYVAILLGALCTAYIMSRLVAFQKALQLFVLIIFSFSLLENIIVAFNKEKEKISFQNQKMSNFSFAFKEKPNIYYLLLDAYPRADALKTFENYDNTNFVNFFKNKGFIVAEKSYSNYSNTSESLSSIFQLDYLKEGDVQWDDVLSPDKIAFSILKDNNYRFILLPPFCDFLQGRKTADLVISSGFPILFSMSNISFIRTSFGVLFLRLIDYFLYFNINDVRKVLQFTRKEEDFVFIHYLHFHDYAYDKNCKINPQLVVKKNSEGFQTNISCINSFIMDSINEIMAHDPKSIILVQADHGPWFWRAPPFYWLEQAKDSADEVEKAYAIFSAIYIPDLDKNSSIAKYLADSPSPVNNFRIIFSHLANSPVDLLPNRQFKIDGQEVTHYRREAVTKEN